MSYFSDQFDREDPHTFKYPDLFGLWPDQCLQECRLLLIGLSRDDIRSMAEAIEQTIEDRTLDGIARGISTKAKSKKQDVMSLPPTWQTDTHKLRAACGDLNLWLDISNGADAPCPIPETTEAEALAVLAIWKFVDSKTALVPQQVKFRWPEAHPPVQVSPLEAAAALAMEAMAATKIAVQKKLEGKLIAAAVQEVALKAQLAIKDMVSKRHSKGAKEGHAKLNGKAKARAIQIANASQFVTYTSACNFIKPRLESELKCFVEPRTICGWLKASGWAPIKRGSSKPKA